MTIHASERASRVQIPADFPHPQRLAGRDLFIAILGEPSPATFARWLAEGKLPKPRKLGSRNRWPETIIAAARDSGIA
ncbi:helix-turn-helix transcriptional regulator [Nitrobacter sp. JJSN]|uniref:helix-turn-helix transcriptional regulator n=1 Tax=Nitrobacter sp. JJSN TaxID=3453033 RepID=UPI003F75A694